MTKMRKSRKGFTLTELAIVIAVIAILIAVLVPTFVSLINKAKESSDSQLVKNINTAVAIEDATGNVQTAGDAINVALNNGYSVSNLTPMSDGNVIVYDQISKRFALISEETLSGGGDAPIYADSSTTKTNFTTYTTFVFVKTSDSIVSGDATGYTITGTNSYILSGDDWNGAIVTASYGIDDSLVSVDTVKAGTADVTPESTASAGHAAAKAKIAEDAAKTTYPLIYNIHAVNFEYNGSGVDVISYGTPSYVKVTASSDSDKITINGTCISVIIQSENKGNIEINASITYLCNDSSVSVSVNSSTSYKDVSSNNTSEDLYAETKISVDSNGVVTPGTRTNLVTGEVVDYIGSADDWTYDGTTLKSYTGSDSEVVIPVGTTIIYQKPFINNTTITSVVIPDSVTKIVDGSSVTATIGAFSGCTNLTSITIGSGLQSIGQGTFSGCESLKSVTFPAGLQSIGNYAFMKCSSLESVNIPNGVTTLGTWVFQYCSNLKQVIIGNGITDVQEGAFYYCESLSSITLPEGLKTIGTNAFLECKALNSISLPSGITSIGGGAFAGTGYVTNYSDSENGVYIGTYLIYGSDVENFTVTDGTTLIATYAFSAYDNVDDPDYFTELKTVTIPDSVKYINNMAFKLSSLESINLGNGVTTIGASAFSECTSLTSITIPSSVTSIGTTAFNGCTSLTTVTFAENSNLKTISTKAFMGCTALTEIVIPESTNDITINAQAFSGCTSLKSVTISSSVTSIYNNTFKNCGTSLNEGESLEIYFLSEGAWTVNKQTVTVDTATNYNEYLTSTYLSYNWTKQ